jgi:uncharacterized RDD family membrane protein YckC
MPPASMGQRFGGALLDILILGPVTGYLAWRAWDTGSAAPTWLATAIVAAYTIVLTAMWGQTLGKRVVGSRVVMEGAAGDEPCTWTGSAIRYAVPFVPGLLPVVGDVLGFVMVIVVVATMATDDLHRGVHDRAAGTRVVDLRTGGRLTDRYQANVRSATTEPRPRRKRRRAGP